MSGLQPLAPRRSRAVGVSATTPGCVTNRPLLGQGSHVREKTPSWMPASRTGVVLLVRQVGRITGRTGESAKRHQTIASFQWNWGVPVCEKLMLSIHGKEFFSICGIIYIFVE